MEDGSLKNSWGKQLTGLGWPERAINQSNLALAASNRQAYNRVIRKCKKFTETKEVDFPPNSSATLAEFLCKIGDESDRPRSALNATGAALRHVYRAFGLRDLTRYVHIERLIMALIKSQTVGPMTKSKVMPTEKFGEMFRSIYLSTYRLKSDFHVAWVRLLP